MKVEYKSRCKLCGHDPHAEEPGMSCAVLFCDYGEPREPEYCDCFDYIPSGNLEFLAWKYEQNQLQKSL